MTGRGAPLSLCLAVLALTTLLAWRASPAGPVGTPVLVEIRGDVPRPGLHRFTAPTLATALERAGGEGGDARALRNGDRVTVTSTGLVVDHLPDRLLVGEILDPNVASLEALQALPGVGPVVAERIVAGRPYRQLDELHRVRGLYGERRTRALRHMALEPMPPLALSTADVTELITLPGIGPALAERIVAAREPGAFVTVDDLVRVRGIGPATVDRLRDLVVP